MNTMTTYDKKQIIFAYKAKAYKKMIWKIYVYIGHKIIRLWL